MSQVSQTCAFITGAEHGADERTFPMALMSQICELGDVTKAGVGPQGFRTAGAWRQPRHVAGETLGRGYSHPLGLT